MSAGDVTVLALCGAGVVAGLALSGRLHRGVLRVVGDSTGRAAALPLGVAAVVAAATAALWPLLELGLRARPWTTLVIGALVAALMLAAAVPFTAYFVSRTAREDLLRLGAGRRVALLVGVGGALASLVLTCCSALIAVVLLDRGP